MNLYSSVGEEHFGISTNYAAFVGANEFAPTNPSTEEFRMNHSAFLCALCISVATFIFPAPVAAQPAAQALAGKLRLTGSSTLAPVMTELAKRFRLLHPGVEITVEAGGSSRGAADALAGHADIGMVSRELHPDERALFVFTIARDGIALHVHRDNPVAQLTRMQAVELLAGRTGNWKALGGPDAKIEVISRKEGHSSLEIVSHHFGLDPREIKAAQVVGDNAEAARALAANRNALSFFSVGYGEDMMQKGMPLKVLALDGMEASIQAVRAGKWPLARTLNLVTRAVPAGAARGFIEFALSPQAHETIRQYDFVPYEN